MGEGSDRMVDQTSEVLQLIFHAIVLICKRQGENISSNGILKPFAMKVNPGDEGTFWRTSIVMSDVDREKLPSNISQSGVTRLCSIAAVLKDQGVDMKLKNRRWYNRGEKYLRANFDIKVILGAADLKFQLVTKNERVFSEKHDPIEVKWEPPREVNDRDKIYQEDLYRDEP